MNDPSLTVKLVRRNCLECSGDSRPAVIWCICHGEDGSICEFWPFRFGMQPATFRNKYGARLLTPSLMPPGSIDLESLPGTLEEAATAEINIKGYSQPAVSVERKPRRQLTPEQRKAAGERLRKAREARKAGEGVGTARAGA